MLIYAVVCIYLGGTRCLLFYEFTVKREAKNIGKARNNNFENEKHNVSLSSEGLIGLK